MEDGSDADLPPEETNGENGEDAASRIFHDLEVMRGSLVVVAAGIVVGFLYIARVILIPVVLAIFLAYVLNPLVEQLSKLRIPKTDLRLPRFISVSVVVLLAVVLTGALSVVLGDQVRQFAAEIPRYSQEIGQQIGKVRTKFRDVEEYFDRAVQPIRPQPGKSNENAVDEPNSGPTPEPPSQKRPGAPPTGPPGPGHDPTMTQAAPADRQIVVRSGSSLWARLSPYVTGSITGLVGFAVQALTLVFVLFFVLLQAPAFKEKLLNIGGTTPERREAILHALRDINSDIQGYLFGRFLINAGLAVAIAVSFFVYGLNYALLIGILGGLLNFIPYFGAVVGMIMTGVVAYMQFGLASVAATTMFIYFILTSIEGNLITPIVLSRQLQLNSLAVLLGLIFWGWLWGPVGMLLAIPILAVIRVVGERVDELEPVAEILRG